MALRRSNNEYAGLKTVLNHRKNNNTREDRARRDANILASRVAIELLRRKKKYGIYIDDLL